MICAMAATIIHGIDDLKQRDGTHLGYSPWHQVTQNQIDQFADATGDHQWIHVDPERAASGPFGSTIGHGYLTLSLGPYFLPQVIDVQDISMGLNYGCEKVRFPSPVKVDSNVRMGAELKAVTDIGGGVAANIVLTFEIEGSEKPACVAEVVYRYYV
jgi:acyl dehydratase